MLLFLFSRITVVTTQVTRFCLHRLVNQTTYLLPDLWLPTFSGSTCAFPVSNQSTHQRGSVSRLAGIRALIYRSPVFSKENSVMNPRHREAPGLASLHLFQELSTLVSSARPRLCSARTSAE
jgi:hypothetical protein